MQIYIDSYGAYLGVRNGMFWVKPRHSEGRAFPVREVDAILMTQGAGVSTDALILAIHNAIPVLLLDHVEHPIGQVWSGQFGSISTIRKNQALFSTDLQGMEWVRQVLMQKAAQQAAQLLSLSEEETTPAGIRAELIRSAEGIAAIRRYFEDWRYDGETQSGLSGTFRGWEGTATRYYFQAISGWLPPRYRFPSRSKRPAWDPFSALLNYLYGMLYPMVELALMKAGLDPYTGIHHADEYNRPTMVYDAIELYRHWPERVALELCRREDILPPDAFSDTEREGVRLAPPGKSTVVHTFLRFMQEKVEYKGALRKRATHIDLEASRLAAELKTFRPTIMLN